MVILDDNGDGDGIETCMDVDEGTEEEQKGQTNVSGEGDPDWRPEAKSKVQNNKITTSSSITVTTTLLLIIITIINLI